MDPSTLSSTQKAPAPDNNQGADTPKDNNVPAEQSEVAAAPETVDTSMEAEAGTTVSPQPGAQPDASPVVMQSTEPPEEAEMGDATEPSISSEAEGTSEAQPAAPAEPVSPLPDASAAPNPEAAPADAPAPADQPTEVSPDVAPAPVVTGTGKSSKKLLIALFLLVLLLGGAVAYYFLVYLPSKNEGVVKRALVNTLDTQTVKTAKFTGSVSYRTKSNGQTFNVGLEGAMGEQGALDLKVNADLIVAKLQGEIISTDGNNFFFKVAGLDALQSLLGSSTSGSAYSALFQKLNNQWFSVGEDYVKDTVGPGADVSLNRQISQADLQRVAKIYDQHKFMKVKKSLGSEQIAGQDSYHYLLGLDKQELVAFLNAVRDAKLQTLPMTQEDVDELSKLNLDRYNIEMWVAKDSMLMDQLRFSTESDKSALDVKLTFTDYNKPVNIQKPTGAKPFSDLLGGTAPTTGTGTPTLQGLPNGITL